MVLSFPAKSTHWTGAVGIFTGFGLAAKEARPPFLASLLQPETHWNSPASHTRARALALPTATVGCLLQNCTVQYSTLLARTINTPAANTADTATAKATQRDRRESKRRKESVSHQKAYITQPPLPSFPLPSLHH